MAWASSPTARSPAAGCQGAGPPTRRRPRRPPSGALRSSAWRRPENTRSREASGRRGAARYATPLPETQRNLEAVERLALVTDEAGLSLIELAIAFVAHHPAVT